ncbi:DUF2627 domain-containing protein [Paenalkalicoccus suaedae]|uniref:DUF2627 domain-containing protein n=1 Tax=Paenalkalicoccus suaedae TaxID=2592382 RepID=A0A859FEG2_9BACI|nr:DUF2627 domain-containing protein [Paenalkalicoccus suaedae]QKS70974.1 DUF2627 domain-containing protein [Paenalkalicoccus suaedae]
MTFIRFIALAIAILPVILAGYGIKLMRDTLFNIVNSPWPSAYIQFLVGIIALAVGIWLIGGFILHRDRKNNKVAPRFQKQARQ